MLQSKAGAFEPNMRILTLSYEFPPIGGGGSGVVKGLAREKAIREEHGIQEPGSVTKSASVTVQVGKGKMR